MTTYLHDDTRADTVCTSACCTRVFAKQDAAFSRIHSVRRYCQRTRAPAESATATGVLTNTDGVTAPGSNMHVKRMRTNVHE